jgi:hypothetical protein
MPSPEQSAGDDDGIAGPPPGQHKNGTRKAPIALVLVILLLLVAGGIGLATLIWVHSEDVSTVANAEGPDDFKFDLPTVARELADDPEGAKSKYRGRMIDFLVSEIVIESRDRSHVVLLLPVEDKGTPASAYGLAFKGDFPFANPRNAFLKETQPGPLRVRVRGTVARIDPADAPDTGYTFVLDPAWVGRVE